MKFLRFFQRASSTHANLPEAQIINGDENIAKQVTLARFVCFMGYCAVMGGLSLLFFVTGTIYFVKDSERDVNNRLDWPECDDLPPKETFEDCQERLLHRYEAGMIAGGMMFTFCCIAAIVAIAVRGAELLVSRRQRTQLIQQTAAEQHQSYGTL